MVTAQPRIGEGERAPEGAVERRDEDRDVRRGELVVQGLRVVGV